MYPAKASSPPSPVKTSLYSCAAIFDTIYVGIKEISPCGWSLCQVVVFHNSTISLSKVCTLLFNPQR